MTDIATPVAVPTPTDGVVVLRPHRTSDADDLVAWARDPETIAWTSVPVPYVRDDALSRIRAAEAGRRDGSAVAWVIEAPDDDGVTRFAGQIDLRTGPPPDVGFGLARWARGRGFMTRALRLAADRAFDDMGLPVLHWSAMAGNWPSWRVAHACGFTFEGTRTMAVPTRDGLSDSWHAVLRPDPSSPVARRAPVTTWWPVPVLDGDGIRLRAHTDADLPRIAEARSDERARQWSARLRGPFSTDDARAFLREMWLDESLGRRVSWAIADRSDDRLLGHVTVTGMDHVHSPHGAEVGYWAHPDARGRGVVTEAVRLARRHAFTPVADGGLGRTRLTIGASWGNAASRHVAESNGFRPAGRFRRNLVRGRDNEIVDDGAWYDLLPDDV